MPRYYQKGQPLSHLGAFQLICEEALKDGVITGAEGQILHQLAQALKIGTEAVRAVLTETEGYLREKPTGGVLDPRTAYQRVLRYCQADGLLDETEQDLLKELRQILCISLDFHQRSLMDLTIGVRGSDHIDLGRWEEALAGVRELSRAAETAEVLQTRGEGLVLLLTGAVLADTATVTVQTGAVDDLLQLGREKADQRSVAAACARALGPAGILLTRCGDAERSQALLDLERTLMEGPHGEDPDICLAVAEGAVAFRAALKSTTERKTLGPAVALLDPADPRLVALAALVRGAARRFAASPAIATAKRRFEMLENQPLSLLSPPDH
jgi:hypothetical protein